MTGHICAHCGLATEASYNLCQPCLTEVARRERTDAGLTPTVQDPETLRKIALLMAPRTERGAA